MQGEESTMSPVYKTHENEEGPTFILSEDILNDQTLSWSARGLMAYLLSKPHDYVLTIADIVQHSSTSKGSVSALLDELITAGYIVKEQERNAAGHLMCTVYHIYESVDFVPVVRAPVAAHDRTGG